MSKRESIERLNLIIKKIRKHPATFKEISDYLAYESEIHGYNFNISQRTFQRDLEEIRSLYNIDIQYNYSKKGYCIVYEAQPEMNERMLESFDMFNALNLTDRLSNHIHFENRRPQGTENLHGLLYAIKNKFQIKFGYKKFWDDLLTERQTEPYALKEYRNRWYVLALDLKDHQVKSFALDRLNNLEITQIPFQFPVEFNVHQHYQYSFGIVSPNGKSPEEIILSFNPFQGRYIKTLPLHASQEILIDNEHEIRIKLKLVITHDFFMELLSFGESLKIIEPKSLIDDVKSTLKKVLDQYNE